MAFVSQYQQTAWKNGTGQPINATNLNKIENQLGILSNNLAGLGEVDEIDGWTLIPLPGKFCILYQFKLVDTGTMSTWENGYYCITYLDISSNLLKKISSFQFWGGFVNASAGLWTVSPWGYTIGSSTSLGYYIWSTRRDDNTSLKFHSFGLATLK